MWITTEKLKAAIESYTAEPVVKEKDLPALEAEYRAAEEAWMARGKELADNTEVSGFRWSVWHNGNGTVVDATVRLNLEDEELERLWLAREAARNLWAAERDRRWSRKAPKGRTLRELQVEIEALAVRVEEHEGKTMSIRSDVAMELGLI